MTTILYARVSTAEQTLDHQETQARAAGFAIDAVVADHGVSGVTTKLSNRPEGKRLFDMLRNGDTLVVRAIDRLGRNYQDVCETIRAFIARGVTIKTVIGGMSFDGQTKDPMQMAIRDALIGFLAAMGQQQAESMKDAQRAGIEHAKAKGQHMGAPKKIDAAKVQELKAAGMGATEISRALKIGVASVYRALGEAVPS